MGLTSKLLASVIAAHTNPLDLATGKNDLSYTKQIDLASGVGANQADKLWHDQRTLAASATEDLDLAGVLVDAFGATFTLARVKGLIVAAAPGNTNNVLIGNATANAWSTLLGATGVATIRPGGLLAVFAPDATAYAVTAGTGDLLKVANSGAGTGVTYDIVIIGAST